MSPFDAWRLSATDLAAAIRRKDITCREATASVLARIAEVNPRINALPSVTAARALAAAEAADAAVARGDPPGDRKSTRLNSSHPRLSRMPSSA